jgi:hypothetical protein
MAYLGSTPTTQSFIAGTDSFNGTGSATNFTLSRLVNSVNDVQVVVNNVVQYPPNYSVSGTTLTISPAPSAGTNNVYVRYLSTTLQSIGVGDLSVSTNKIQTGAVTSDKIAEGAVGTVDIADASITAAKMSGAQSGSAPIYAARAWVNFNGTSTVAIRASGNVTSITDNGTGDYTVNFTTAMSDANYSVSATCGFGASGYGRVAESPSMPGAGTPQATTYVRVTSYTASTVTLTDVANINVAIFR